MPDPKPGTDEVGRDAYDAKKFCELVLYIAKRSEDDPRFCAVKLNKIMYYSDFGAYRRLGQSITGANYQAERALLRGRCFGTPGPVGLGPHPHAASTSQVYNSGLSLSANLMLESSPRKNLALWMKP